MGLFNSKQQKVNFRDVDGIEKAMYQMAPDLRKDTVRLADVRNFADICAVSQIENLDKAKANNYSDLVFELVKHHFKHHELEGLANKLWMSASTMEKYAGSTAFCPLTVKFQEDGKSKDFADIATIMQEQGMVEAVKFADNHPKQKVFLDIVCDSAKKTKRFNSEYIEAIKSIEVLNALGYNPDTNYKDRLVNYVMLRSARGTHNSLTVKLFALDSNRLRSFNEHVLLDQIGNKEIQDEWEWIDRDYYNNPGRYYKTIMTMLNDIETVFQVYTPWESKIYFKDCWYDFAKNNFSQRSYAIITNIDLGSIREPARRFS